MTDTTFKQEEDHWDSKVYQKAASFVPKLATKVLGWLDVQPDDVILDVGCGGMYFLSFSLAYRTVLSLSFCSCFTKLFIVDIQENH